MMIEKPEFSTIEVKLEEGTLKFDNGEGVYRYENTKKVNENKNETENLEQKLEQIEKQKEEYEMKINDLDLKIKNIEKILLMDIKENQYIQLIGKKTAENRQKNDY